MSYLCTKVYSRLHNSIVTLPNHKVIHAHFYGDIHLDQDLILKDMLFLSGFKFNLVPMSSLTLDSYIVLFISHGGFVIDNMISKRKIDKGKRR